MKALHELFHFILKNSAHFTDVETGNIEVKYVVCGLVELFSLQYNVWPSGVLDPLIHCKPRSSLTVGSSTY